MPQIRDLLAFLKREEFREKQESGLRIFERSYFPTLSVRIFLDESSWTIMPIIDARDYPTEDKLSPEKIVQMIMQPNRYPPQNRFTPHSHIMSGDMSELGKFVATYKNIVRLFSDIKTFYNLTN